MIDVKHDHLGRTTRGSTGLDGARTRICTTHERDRAGRSAAAAEQLLARTKTREVEARTRTALEDQAFFAVPVEDGIHRVIDAEDEAGTDLLRRWRADVEPHGRVEAENLVEQHPRHLMLEDLCVGGRREVAEVATSLGVGQHHAVDELAQADLALLTAHCATEVLGRDDRGRVDAPRLGELAVALLEDDIAGLPVGLDDIATLPGHLVIGMHTSGGEQSADGESLASLLVAGGGAVGDLGHGVLLAMVTGWE